MIVVSDTSPVANLILIGELDILRAVFDEIIVPPAVDLEIGQLSAFSVALDTYHNSEWIKKKVPADKERVQKLRNEIDEGESEAIVLAIELEAEYLLIDERLGTRKAKENGLRTIGLIGVLVKAKEKKVIKKVEPLINALIERAGFWVSEKLVERVLKEVKER